MASRKAALNILNDADLVPPHRRSLVNVAPPANVARREATLALNWKHIVRSGALT